MTWCPQGRKNRPMCPAAKGTLSRTLRRLHVGLWVFVLHYKRRHPFHRMEVCADGHARRGKSALSARLADVPTAVSGGTVPAGAALRAEYQSRGKWRAGTAFFAYTA